ncbi:hypothetical protein PGB90_002894 [Kerria lacca]
MKKQEQRMQERTEEQKQLLQQHALTDDPFHFCDQFYEESVKLCDENDIEVEQTDVVCDEDESTASSGLNITSENFETKYAEFEENLIDTQQNSFPINIVELEESIEDKNKFEIINSFYGKNSLEYCSKQCNKKISRDMAVESCRYCQEMDNVNQDLFLLNHFVLNAFSRIHLYADRIRLDRCWFILRVAGKCFSSSR